MEEALTWSALSLGATRRQVLWEIISRRRFPTFCNGIRGALATAFILMVTSEFLIGQRGLGYLIGFTAIPGSIHRCSPSCSRSRRSDSLPIAYSSTPCDAGCDGAISKTSSRHPAALRVASVVGFFVAWEMVSGSGLFSPFLLPAPTTILDYLGATLYRASSLSTCVSFSAECSPGTASPRWLAFPSAYASLGWPWCAGFDPLISIGLPMPQVAFLPIFILWLGAFDASKITLITLSCVFPIIIQSTAGAQGIDQFISWSALSLVESKRRLLWDVALPGALPRYLPACRSPFRSR